MNVRARLEGAKKEGMIAWYTSTNVVESKSIADGFEYVKVFCAIFGL